MIGTRTILAAGAAILLGMASMTTVASARGGHGGVGGQEAVMREGMEADTLPAVTMPAVIITQAAIMVTIITLATSGTSSGLELIPTAAAAPICISDGGRLAAVTGGTVTTTAPGAGS